MAGFDPGHDLSTTPRIPAYTGMTLRSLRRVGESWGARGLEQGGGVLSDRGAVKEIGVLGAPQPHRVAEGEVLEIILGNVTVLDQLPRLRHWLAHVHDVEMPDVGAVDRVDPRAQRHHLAKGDRVHPVVR